jgi:hypothetical protein
MIHIIMDSQLYSNTIIMDSSPLTSLPFHLILCADRLFSARLFLAELLLLLFKAYELPFTR